MPGKTIAVNTRLLLAGKLDGMGWFTYHTLKKITAQNPEHEFLFFFDRPWSEEFLFEKNVKPVALFPQARHPFLYYWWFEHSVPAALTKHKADLFLSPDGYLSLNTPVKQVAVIHDINFEHHPKDLPFLTSHYYRYFFPRFAKKANRVATVSECSKNDIVSTYDIIPDKIDVVYNGVNELYQPLDEERIKSIRNRFSRGCPFFLFVGMLHRRKNIANLLKSFELFKKETPSDVKLLIVGHRKWWTPEMEDAFNDMQHQEDVIFTGRLDITDLVQLTASALAMTYVSYFEGFGVPIIEAMRSGVPVITSNISSMPEVAGNAAVLCDPFSTGSIADAMKNIWVDEALRKKCISNGLKRATDFSWDNTADLLWKSILKAGL
jgi:glycosyltransferase involved in cell wall biosynthesis